MSHQTLHPGGLTATSTAEGDIVMLTVPNPGFVVVEKDVLRAIVAEHAPHRQPREPWAWVQRGQCPACDWSGMHWHWGDGRFRSVRELREADAEAFDRDLGYPRPPGRTE